MLLTWQAPELRPSAFCELTIVFDVFVLGSNSLMSSQSPLLYA